MLGINVFRFNLEQADHGIGKYFIGGDRWVEIMMGGDGPVAVVWNGCHRTVRKFSGLPARLIAVKMLDIGRPVEDLPSWCGPMLVCSDSPMVGRRRSRA